MNIKHGGLAWGLGTLDLPSLFILSVLLGWCCGIGGGGDMTEEELLRTVDVE